MEYVEKLTLREAIDDGISEVDSWRILVRFRFPFPSLPILSLLLYVSRIARLFPLLHRDTTLTIISSAASNLVGHATFHLAQVRFALPLFDLLSPN
jgi:hypothetical protein